MDISVANWETLINGNISSFGLSKEIPSSNEVDIAGPAFFGVWCWTDYTMGNRISNSMNASLVILQFSAWPTRQVFCCHKNDRSLALVCMKLFDNGRRDARNLTGAMTCIMEVAEAAHCNLLCFEHVHGRIG